jgi:L-lactate dehydrogenase complex protein LldG
MYDINQHGSQHVDIVDAFASEAEAYDVTVRRVATTEVQDTLAALLTDPAIGVELSWDDAALPEAVGTNPTVGELDDAHTGITEAALGVASYGSIALRQDDCGSEPISLMVDTHIAVVHEDDIVADMADAFAELGDSLRDLHDSFILATGPSATADMGALVQGAHGPKDVTIIIHS